MLRNVVGNRYQRAVEEEVARLVVDEGATWIGFAGDPMPDNLPSGWAKALGSHDVASAITHLWSPFSPARLVGAMRTRLRGLALLRTDRAPSLLYLFELDGNPVIYRGLPPHPPARREARAISNHDLSLWNNVHDGFIGLDGVGGALPAERWTYMSELVDADATWESARKHFDPAQYLLVTWTGIPLYIGFLMTGKMPRAVVFDEEAGRVEKPVLGMEEALDKALEQAIGELDPI
jgi:hypothetical protein